ncbi:MAG: methyltransferase domain-containing protein [Candidatus Hinthialibacter antarcticus]|nr:methyltransferase domain-containing protein [Candidatus Hinthialibacter antarcticus]
MVEYGIVLLVFIALVNGAAYLGAPEWVSLVLLLLLAAPTLYGAWFGAPYIPSANPAVERALGLAELKPGDVFIDLGCGDGRSLRAAKARGAQAIGYEISLFMYCIAKRLRGCEVRLGNFWSADLSEADVVYCYLTPKAMERIEREIWPKLKPGCRLVCNTFNMPTLAPDETRGPMYLYRKF